MKAFKLELSPEGLSPDEFEKKALEKVQEYKRLNAQVFAQQALIDQVPAVVAKHLGKPEIKTITEVINVLAPYSQKYSAKAKSGNEGKKRKKATEEDKTKAIAALKAGKKHAEVAKESGMSVAWVYNLEKTYGGAKPKKSKATKPKP